MKQADKVKAEYAEKLAKAEREDAIFANLPYPGLNPRVCLHSYSKKQYASVTYSDTYPNRLPLEKAVEVYKAFKPYIVSAEHWKHGTLEIAPAEINSKAEDKHETSTMDGESWTELVLHTAGNRGEIQSTELQFWAKLYGEWISVSIEIQPKSDWLPERQARFNRSGDVSSFSLTPKFIGEDQRRQWWSERPNYRLSYYWADVHNFESWLPVAPELLQ